MISRKVYHKGGRRTKRSHGKKMRKQSRRKSSNRHRHTRKLRGGLFGITMPWEKKKPPQSDDELQAEQQLKNAREEARRQRATLRSAQKRAVAAGAEDTEGKFGIKHWFADKYAAARGLDAPIGKAQREAIRKQQALDKKVLGLPVRLLNKLSAEDARKMSYFFLQTLASDCWRADMSKTCASNKAKWSFEQAAIDEKAKELGLEKAMITNPTEVISGKKTLDEQRTALIQARKNEQVRADAVWSGSMEAEEEARQAITAREHVLEGVREKERTGAAEIEAQKVHNKQILAKHNVEMLAAQAAIKAARARVNALKADLQLMTRKKAAGTPPVPGEEQQLNDALAAARAALDTAERNEVKAAAEREEEAKAAALWPPSALPVWPPPTPPTLTPAAQGGPDAAPLPGNNPPPDPAAWLDANPSCGAWAGGGECENNPQYMMQECPHACAAARGTEEEVAAAELEKARRTADEFEQLYMEAMQGPPDREKQERFRLAAARAKDMVARAQQHVDGLKAAGAVAQGGVAAAAQPRKAETAAEEPRKRR